MKVHEWLEKFVDSHAIQDHEKLSASFLEHTGKEPCWPTHTVRDTNKEAGTFKGPVALVAGPDHLLVSYGWQVAEALESKLVGTASYAMFNGRGSSFRAGLEALKKPDI